MVVKAALSSCHVQNNPRKSTKKQPTEILLNKRVQSRDALWYSRIVKDGDLVRAADWCGDSFKILHEDRRCIRWLNSVSRLKVSDVAVVLELFSHTKNVFSSLRTKLLLKSRTTAQWRRTTACECVLISAAVQIFVLLPVQSSRTSW